LPTNCLQRWTVPCSTWVSAGSITFVLGATGPMHFPAGPPATVLGFRTAVAGMASVGNDVLGERRRPRSSSSAFNVHCRTRTTPARARQSDDRQGCGPVRHRAPTRRLRPRIDSERHTPAGCAELIRKRLDHEPGAAFERLRSTRHWAPIPARPPPPSSRRATLAYVGSEVASFDSGCVSVSAWRCATFHSPTSRR
jgi:hypothetical protein